MQTLSNSPNNDAAIDWMRQYQTQKRKCEEENGVLRNIVKRAKADGMNTKAMIATIVASKLDPDVVQADLRDQIRYMALRRMPVTQAELFEGMDLTVSSTTQAEDDIWDAEDAGYRAGRHGVKIEDCPYPPGSELQVRWERFWSQGQAAIARELGDNATVASTSRARPARQSSQSPLIASEEDPADADDGMNDLSAADDPDDPPVVSAPMRVKRPRKAGGARRSSRRSNGPADIATTSL